MCPEGDGYVSSVLFPIPEVPNAAKEVFTSIKFFFFSAASQEYGNIVGSRSGASAARRDVSATSAAETRTNTKFLQSNSTDR